MRLMVIFFDPRRGTLSTHPVLNGQKLMRIQQQQAVTILSHGEG